MKYLSENLKNAVIYCRVSSEEQAKEGESLGAQERRCKAYCESKGWQVLKTFIEAGESGRTEERTQLKKLLAFCFERAHKVAAVVCLKQDRFSRNLFDFRKLEDAFSARGISLIFVEGNNERNAQGKLIRNISGSFAEFESDINSERTRAGMAEAVLTGRWIFRLLGYSFKQNECGKRQLYPNDKADIIRQIFKLAHEGIYKQSEILVKMKRGGFTISKQSLAYLLKNPVYCGLLPDKYGQNGGNFIKGIHEPLISEQMFFEVQDILSGRARTATPPRRNNPEFPLRRFVVCSNCGRLLTACYSKGRNMKVGYYQCQTKGCPRHQKKIIEPAFLEYLTRIKPTPQALKI
ncbi:MAG: recombinase family protein, partial [Elusimicrobiota bacterium]|nr:recombinase family protein [Elusimicrobiota bacterium]